MSDFSYLNDLPKYKKKNIRNFEFYIKSAISDFESENNYIVTGLELYRDENGRPIVIIKKRKNKNI